jgi:hypothetical protein
LTTAAAIAATRDAKKRWCGAHDAAANGDLMRLKAYIDASEGSPKRNVSALNAVDGARARDALACIEPRRVCQFLVVVMMMKIMIMIVYRYMTSQNSAQIPSSPRVRVGIYPLLSSFCRLEAHLIKLTLKRELPCITLVCCVRCVCVANRASSCALALLFW